MISQPDYHQFQQIIGYRFNDLELLARALIHRSYLNENKSVKTSNERLEFLGDSILSLVVSNHLFAIYNTNPEGDLTNLRSKIVRTETLASAANRLNLGQFMCLSRGELKSGGRHNPSLLADLFEAIIGAIYLDGNYTAANHFIHTHLIIPFGQDLSPEAVKDPKSKLQELGQKKYKTTPIYKILSSSGPDHHKSFTCGVFLASNKIATGQGKSKQTAETNAAKFALKMLKSNINNSSQTLANLQTKPNSKPAQDRHSSKTIKNTPIHKIPS